MKRIFFLLSLPLFLLFLGCAATQYPELAGWRSFSLQKGVDIKTTRQPISPDLKNARLAYIEKKQSELNQIMGLIDNKLGDLRSLADRNTKLNLTLGALGIVSGIAATALAIASPANVVWVAGFSGFGTGVISFQTRAAVEGYSRDAVARVYNETIAKIEDATIQIGADIEFLRKNIESTDDSFDSRAGQLENKIIRLNTAAVLTPIIVGTDQDIENLKKINKDIQDRLEKAENQIKAFKKDE